MMFPHNPQKQNRPFSTNHQIDILALSFDLIAILCLVNNRLSGFYFGIIFVVDRILNYSVVSIAKRNSFQPTEMVAFPRIK